MGFRLRRGFAPPTYKFSQIFSTFRTLSYSVQPTSPNGSICFIKFLLSSKIAFCLFKIISFISIWSNLWLSDPKLFSATVVFLASWSNHHSPYSTAFYSKFSRFFLPQGKWKILQQENHVFLLLEQHIFQFLWWQLSLPSLWFIRGQFIQCIVFSSQWKYIRLIFFQDTLYLFQQCPLYSLRLEPCSLNNPDILQWGKFRAQYSEKT